MEIKNPRYHLRLGPDKLSSSPRASGAKSEWEPIEQSEFLSRLVAACKVLQSTYPHFGLAGLTIVQMFHGLKTGPWKNVTYRLENGGKALSLEKYTEHCVGDMESFLEAQPAFDRIIMRNEVRWRLHLEFTSKEKSMLKEAMGLDISVKKVAEPRMSHTFARSPRFKPRGVASRASLPARHTQRDTIGHEKSSPSAFFPKAQFDLMAITSETPGPGFYASQAFATPRRHRSETSMPESRAQTFQRFYDRQLEYARSKTVLARVRREEEQRRRAGSPTNRSSRSPGTARKPVSGTTSPDK